MMDGWDRFCPNCNEYKGVMNVVAAVLARKYQYGEINFAEKRDDIYFADGYEAYAIRFNGHRWATVAVKVAD